MELPYLTGRSDYLPPIRRSAGQWRFSRVSFRIGRAIWGDRVRELPDGELPGLSVEWVATPGHSPGMSRFSAPPIVCYWRRCVRDDEHGFSLGLGSGKKLSRGKRLNMDWRATQESIEKLADLRPNVLGCGHGIPMRTARCLIAEAIRRLLSAAETRALRRRAGQGE